MSRCRTLPGQACAAVTGVLVLLSAVLAGVGWAMAEAVGPASIASDFRVVAEYWPSPEPLDLSWRPWILTITADGRAVQEVHINESTIVKKGFLLSQEQLIQLVTKIEAAGFYLISGNHEAKVTDNDALVLRVRMNQKSHDVTVQGPYHLKDHEEVAAFLRIWNAILNMAPAPNRGQTVE